jgi:serine/threonine-protein kinase
MKKVTFFDRYRIAAGSDSDDEVMSRSGLIANYRAIDTQSKETVALQLVPALSVDAATREDFAEHGRAATKLDHVNIARVFAAGVEGENLAVVSEYLEGETADTWIAANGPMPPDAVLRMGLQIVRALGAAMFHGIAHRAVQPSNILIVSGEAPDGGWPFIKLLNFGLAGAAARAENKAGPSDVATKPSATFASPEQLLGKPIDFRSEIYSLGATMCFLLTGAVPLAVGGMKARLRARRLPELRRAPRSLRALLTHMLRENPDNRPHDPIAFEAEMRNCLTKLERRQAIGRKIGIPLATVLPARAARAMAERP